MKKVFSVLAVLLVTTCMTVSTAQAGDKIGLKLGVDGAFVLPLSDWGDISGIGLGGMARLSYCIDDAMSVNLRAGYIFHMKKDVGGADASTSELPILFGFRYVAPMGLFGEAALGLVNIGAEVDAPAPIGNYSDSEMKFGALVGAGYSMSGFSISANLFMPSLEDVGEGWLSMLLLVGYDFASF